MNLKPIIYLVNTLNEALRSAFHSLWAHKLRSGLTLLSILIGVATIIVLVSVISGLNSKIADEFSQLGTNVLYVGRRPWTSRGRDWHKWHNTPRLTMREVNVIKASCLLADKVVYSTYNNGTTVSHRDNSMELTVEGTTWELPDIQPMNEIEKGRFFAFSEDKKGRPVCVIGYDVASSLFENEDALGKRVKIAGNSFIVVGVMKKQGQSMFMGSTDDDVLIPYNAFSHTFGRNRRFQIMVSASKGVDIEDLRAELRHVVRLSRKLKPWDEDNFAINSQDMLLDEYNKITSYLWAAIIAIGALALLVGGIGVMNIMLITVTERTREIGLRKAVGATRMHILSQFLLEALAQCWIGGSIGFVIGIGLPMLVSMVIEQLPFALSWSAAFAAIGFTSFIGISFGLYPALKAAKLSPVEALRYE